MAQRYELDVEELVVKKDVDLEGAVRGIKIRVDLAMNLPDFGAKEGMEFFRGMLSTDPEKVHPAVSEDLLRSRCGRVSRSIRDSLSDLGISSQVCYAHTESKVPFDHVHLTTVFAGHKLLVDGTIGQLLLGHNHVFVGPRSKLQDIIENQTGINMPYMLSDRYKQISPARLFVMAWGNESVPAETFYRWPIADATRTIISKSSSRS